VPVREHRVQTEPQVAVRVVEQRPSGPVKGELILVHGLEGSSEGGYMRSMAWNALQRGYAVHRMNIRGCGGTEGWCNTLYHAGLTSDLRFYIDQLQSDAPVVVAGYSLGGNQTLRLAGEGHAKVSRFVAVSAPIDLAACVRALGRKANFLYQNRFVRRMQDRLEERRRQQPEAFDPIFERTNVRAVRTVYEFDDRITAPHFGFGSAGNYYTTQSSQNGLAAIRTPTLLLTAQDDPLVPFDVYRNPAISTNPNLTLLAPSHGGHVAFLAKELPRFWADEAILDWLDGTNGGL